MLWGLSPSLNLLDEIKSCGNLQGKKELNVLIAGAADARHVLKTMSKSFTDDVVIHFYVLDLLMEFVARQMLLMTIALEPSDKLGPIEKARLWMEVYGNSLLRPNSAEYIVQKSYQLIHMVTNEEYLNKRMPCLDLSLMKYREKDSLENIFRYWTSNDFNIINNWDLRLRKSLGVRYDSKMGAFDWDYHMKLKGKEDLGLIHSIEYKQWRNTGVAFTWLETEFNVTNPSFALGIFPQGDTILSHGFCGDIEWGPYFAFGLQCEDESMLKTSNGTYRKRATDVMERNMIRIFNEIEHSMEYVHVERDERDMGVTLVAVSNLDIESDPKMKVDLNKEKEDYSPIGTSHKIHFIPTNSLEMYPEKEKYKNFFDLAFVSQGLFNKINSKVVTMLKKEAPLLVETRLFCFTISKESQKEYEEVVRKTMDEVGFEGIGKCDFSKQSIVRFKAKK